MTPREDATYIEVDGHAVRVTNPTKVFFPALGVTKLDLVRYYLAVAAPALRGIRGRPMILKRYPNGVAAPPFFQKRAPSARPDWLRTQRITFPSGRSADEVVVEDTAGLAWVVNLGCIDLHPWPVRYGDVDHPDELRVDLDPSPGARWRDVTTVASVVRDVLAEHRLTGFPKTSGSRGLHVLVRIAPRWTFDEVRRAALALAREVERRQPFIATSRWWKEERPRGSVFVDYNQNARDRTVASAYSVRPMPDARVSCPLRWDEVGTVDPAALTLRTVPARVARLGDPAEPIDEVVGSLEGLLELAERQAATGIGEAPYPPHFPKAAGEPRRVSPSRRRAG